MMIEQRVLPPVDRGSNLAQHLRSSAAVTQPAQPARRLPRRYGLVLCMIGFVCGLALLNLSIGGGREEDSEELRVCDPDYLTELF